MSEMRWGAAMASLLASLALLAGCGGSMAERKGELAQLSRLLPGEYDNKEQASSPDAANITALRIAIVPIYAPLVGRDIFYLQEMAADDARRVTAQRVLSLEVTPDGKLLQGVYSLERALAVARRAREGRPLQEPAAERPAARRRAATWRGGSPASGSRARAIRRAAASRAAPTARPCARNRASRSTTTASRSPIPRSTRAARATRNTAVVSLQEAGALKRRIGRLFFLHVLREIVLNVLSVSVILLLLLVTNQVASVLRRAAEGEIPASVVYELAKLSVGENSVVILPIALLIGILLALGRLYHDSELAAAQACGLGRRQLYGPALLVAAVAAGLCAWIAFSAGPSAARRTFEIRTEALRTAMTRGLAAGQFRSLGGGAVLYFRERDAEGLLRRRVLPAAGEGHRHRRRARAARHARSDGRRSRELFAVGGRRPLHRRALRRPQPSRRAGAGRVACAVVRQAHRADPTPTTVNYRGRADMLSTGALLADPTPKNLGELHWRIATVCITLLLGFLAVPLSKLRPRQGRYARVGYGVLLYAIYANLLIAGRTLLEQGRLPGWLGLWWVHAVVIVLALLLLWAPKLLHRAAPDDAPAAARAAGLTSTGAHSCRSATGRARARDGERVRRRRSPRRRARATHRSQRKSPQRQLDAVGEALQPPVHHPGRHRPREQHAPTAPVA